MLLLVQSCCRMGSKISCDIEKWFRVFYPRTTVKVRLLFCVIFITTAQNCIHSLVMLVTVMCFGIVWLRLAAESQHKASAALRMHRRVFCVRSHPIKLQMTNYCCIVNIVEGLLLLTLWAFLKDHPTKSSSASFTLETSRSWKCHMEVLMHHKGLICDTRWFKYGFFLLFLFLLCARIAANCVFFRAMFVCTEDV